MRQGIFCRPLSEVKLLLILFMIIGCGKSSFFQASKNADKATQEPPVFEEDAMQQTPEPLKAHSCSDVYVVSALANPYLAGMPSGSTIGYLTSKAESIDSAPKHSPILVTPKSPDCLKEGAAISFTVSGSITYGSHKSAVDANGLRDRAAVAHKLGSKFGKSNIKAPLSSLLGVFLGPGEPTNAAPPPMLDFSTPEQRNQLTMRPLVGQLFYIGDGKDAQGKSKKVIVPAGASRFYLAVMDEYEWNNNAGEFSCSIEGNLP